MGKSIIFVFSGTGNSLWAARKISEELENCVICSMGLPTADAPAEEYEAIGFVYPTYFRGAPARVQQFVSQFDFQKNRNAYFFAVATCGNVDRACNATAQLQKLLKRKGITLHYSEKLGMFSNYILLYDMRDTAQEEARQAARDLEPIVDHIKNRTVDPVPSGIKPLQQLLYQGFVRLAPRMDRYFNVSGACTHCRVCQKVCPVNNIDVGQEKKPTFKHHCEQCLACIQHCPARAINYKDKTQNRKRYAHPDIPWTELAKLNGN